MNKELKEHIEVAKGMITGKSGRKPTIKELEEIMEHQDVQLLPDGSITVIKLTKTEQATISTLISCAEELEAIKGTPDELPKKKEIIHPEWKGMKDSKQENLDYGYACGFNQCLDRVKPIYEKQVLRIKELGEECDKYQEQTEQARACEDEINEESTRLKEELAWWHNLIRKHHNNETCPNLKTYVENLQKENARLKQKEELEQKEWRVRLKPDSTEGYCWQEQKIIDVGLKNENPLRLLLHEIAHINNNPHGNKHNQKWFDDFLLLMKKYMPTMDISESDKIIQKVYKLKMKAKASDTSEMLMTRVIGKFFYKKFHWRKNATAKQLAGKIIDELKNQVTPSLGEKLKGRIRKENKGKVMVEKLENLCSEVQKEELDVGLVAEVIEHEFNMVEAVEYKIDSRTYEVYFKDLATAIVKKFKLEDK